MNEVIIVSFLRAVETADVLTTSNTDVKLVETRTEHFARYNRLVLSE